MGWTILFAVAVPVLSWFIKEIPLRGGYDGPTRETPEEQAETALATAPAH